MTEDGSRNQLDLARRGEPNRATRPESNLPLDTGVRANSVRARSLAQRVTNGIVRTSLERSPPVSRDEFANDLLNKGLGMKVSP